MPSKRTYRQVPAVITRVLGEVTMAWPISTKTTHVFIVGNLRGRNESFEVGDWVCLKIQNWDDEVVHREKIKAQMPTYVSAEGEVRVSSFFFLSISQHKV